MEKNLPVEAPGLHQSLPAGRCKACGSADLERFVDVNDRFSLVECRNCRLVATFPVLTDAEIADYYPASYYGKSNRRFNLLFERLIPVFRSRRRRAIERFARAGRLLDVGCGRGLLPALMRARGWEVHGVEFSDWAARHAREELHVPVFVGDFLESPYPPGFFDVVVFWHVLEHVRDPVAALRKSREILKPGGLLVVAVPNLESYQAVATRRHWFHLDVPRHYHHFRLGVLRRILEESGFSVESVSHFSLEYNPYGWIQSILNQMGFQENLLYDTLKNKSARTIKSPARAHPVQFFLMLLALVFVVPLSFVLFLLEVVVRRGGTIELYARSDREPNRSQ
ncbi:MAG: class I SAM-dependent methyltransferase [Acidobacteriota bacterium]